MQCRQQGYDPSYARQVEFKSDLLKDLATCISTTVQNNKTWSGDRGTT
jgi:hypothetical protein